MSNLRKIVCGRLCAYHRPGKRDEPGCGGLVRLAGCGVTADQLLLSLTGDDGGVLWGIPQDAPFLLDICSSCGYFVDGCDFRDPEASRDTCSPCGGLRAVALLSKRGPPA